MSSRGKKWLILGRHLLQGGHVGAAPRAGDGRRAAGKAQCGQQLRGFQRVSLQPGESKTVTFTLGFDDLAMYDARMQQVVEPGTFTVFVGGSSDRTQQATFTVGAR